MIDVFELMPPSLRRRPFRRRWLAVMLLCLAIGAWSSAALAADGKAHVLVIYALGRLLPANLEFDGGLRRELERAKHPAVEIDAEFLDFQSFGGDIDLENFARYLSVKYRVKVPDLVVVTGIEALNFLIARGDLMFPRVPVVIAGVEASLLDASVPMPDRVAGHLIEIEFARTVDQALKWHPKARTLWVITGASPRDQGWERQLRQRARSFEGRVAVEFLSGLPTRALLDRVSHAGPDVVGYFRDGAGVSSVPRASVQALAAVSKAPVYGGFAIGTGVVGGHFIDFDRVGQQAGEDVQRILAGEPAASLGIVGASPSTLVVDWRQVQRWGIDEHAIPADAIVRFREPSILQSYRYTVIGAVAILLIQAGLIGGLLLERRRRRRAEFESQQRRHELAHASRVAMTAELTGAIAHEINQPLGAILTNADAADLGLRSGRATPELLREIMVDIHRDVLRASEVVKRLRDLYSKKVMPNQPVDLNAVLAEVQSFLQTEARRRRMTIEIERSAVPLVISGNSIEIQQVVINLIVNAMDAMDEMPDGRRSVSVTMQAVGRNAVIRVRDRGHGIAPEHMPRLFQSFFTTKGNGMGLGLSISRSLIEAHDGKLTAENAPEGGAVFRIELPLMSGGAPRTTPPA
jgi:signal transduction histidine kinase